ncbi:hypothetical protein [Novosphingobium sp. AAP83]|uniref:hypothetical protein n=1 Tax=Novosphingobium sp. AAP83 TaxID=1523425 RepID=UPI0006B9189A|nr:hypothetical protein [Novosphingobium sp. AAP83]
MKRSPHLFAPVALAGLAALVGGCAPRSDFPSLAPRPAEQAYATARADQAAAQPGIPAGVSEALASRLGAMRIAARDAYDVFDARKPAAIRAASSASGAARGSDAWSAASVAIAGLESARSTLGMTLADLDRLEVEASNRAAGSTDADVKAVREIKNQVEALIESQTDVIDSLLGKISR